MTFKRTVLTIASFFSSVGVFASDSKTFSCNGTYELNDGSPSPSIHGELVYPNSTTNEYFIDGEDSLFILKGSLKIDSEAEYLKIELVSKQSGLVIYNNNSGLNFPVSKPFNFVFVGMQNVGEVTTSQGVELDASKASFQCQTYHN